MPLTELADFSFKHVDQADEPTFSASDFKDHLDVQAREIRAYINGILKTFVDGVELTFKSGSFTRDISTASGTQAITGVGFRPKFIILFAQVAVAGNVSIGITDGTNNAGMKVLGSGSPTTWDLNNVPIYIYIDGTKQYYASGITMDSGGFTVTWVKAGSPTGTMYVGYFAVG